MDTQFWHDAQDVEPSELANDVPLSHAWHPPAASSLPVDEKVPAEHALTSTVGVVVVGLSLHTRSVTLVHLFCTPRSHDVSAAHAVHSPLSFVPDAENLPGVQGAGSLHSMFAVALH